MKTILRFATQLLFALPAVSASAETGRILDGEEPAQFVPGEVLVRFRPDLGSLSRDRSTARHGAIRMASLGSGEYSQVKLVEGQSVESAVASLRKDPDVVSAQPNFIYRTMAVPNDPKYAQLWGLRNSGQTVVTPGGPDLPSASGNPGTSGKDMGLEAAWDQITDCSSVIVAVVDTGVNYNHADLAANMWNGGATYPNHGYDFVDSDNDPMDKAGHGTHVAGTIGAVGNNLTGTTGVCWSASIMAVRVLDATGTGTSSKIVQGINFAVANGAKVINVSIGGSSFDAAYSSAIANAQSSGVLMAAAAGNSAANNDSGTTPTYPCNFTHPNVICVAALDQAYALASFSNFGTTSVDVGAPGVNIVSEWPGAVTVLPDTLLSGWTLDAAWGYKSLNFGSPVACLANPPTYDRSSAKYSNSSNGRAYKSFNIAAANVALLEYKAIVDTESGFDQFETAYKSTGGDPFSGGTTVDSVSGTTSGSRVPFDYDITPCIGATCSIGFRILSDSAINSYGVGVSAFNIKSLNWNTTSYNVISGTSMATPHVAGLAAMLMAYNPGFTYTDAIAAIKGGGVATAALSGKTTSGKAANAMGALSFLAAPASVTAVRR